MDDLAMLLVCLIWGANFTVSKLAFAELPPLAFTALRFVAASALLVAWAAMGERPTWLHVVGGAIVAAGVVLTRARR